MSFSLKLFEYLNTSEISGDYSVEIVEWKKYTLMLPSIRNLLNFFECTIFFCLELDFWHFQAYNQHKILFKENHMNKWLSHLPWSSPIIPPLRQAKNNGYFDEFLVLYACKMFVDVLSVIYGKPSTTKNN